MHHKPFYNVPLDCYLFGANHKPEEEVTQWVLFELIRFYGYSIDQIEVERTVQYGTRLGRLDILVSQNKKPFIVIECKRQKGYNKKKDHMKQAISYASADSIQAEFCVFTDGNIWQVKRKTAAGWVNYPNIPRINAYQETALDFSQLLYNLDEVKPVLHWLYQPISGTDALKFIKAIQPIFYAHSIISEGTNPTLLDIIDHLCRGINIKPDFDGYHHGKLGTAFQLTQLYLQKLGIKNYYKDGLENNLHEVLMIPDMQFKELTETMTEFDSEMDHAAIHLLSALYTVARNFAEQRTEKQLNLSSAFSDELFNFINLGLQRNLQTSLPAKSDNMSVNDIRESCKENWDSHATEHHVNLTEVISYFMGRMKKGLTNQNY